MILMELARTEGLSVQYDVLKALDDVNFVVEERKINALVGPNGAGKSTLINAVTGFIPYGGRVFLRGKDISNLKPHDIVLQGICRTFQISELFEGLTVYESIRIACQSLSKYRSKMFSFCSSLKNVTKKAREMLHTMKLETKEKSLVRELSYGDRRFLEIAIALSAEPEILFLDEPTSGLTGEEKEWMIDLIVKLKQKVTTVIVEHDIDVVMGISDVVTVLAQGKIIAREKPEDVRRNKKVQEVYLGVELC